ncbi:MAG: ABC transporter substrate-binding protein [Gammaproteobacteria bacterium]|nr:ABC transporter substrate-binding protein [Gammaproteobacteria bacterium]
MRQTKHFLTEFGALIVLLVVITGCSEDAPGPLRVGTNTWPGYEPLYLARTLGRYDDSQVHLVELPSASQVIQGIRSGTLEGGALTLDEALSLLDDGIALEVVLVMDYSAGGDMLLTKPEIGSLEDLGGKTIAVETGAVGAILLNGALGQAGLTIGDVNLRPCPVDKHVDCYLAVDAVVTFEPAATRLLKLGAKRLFDSRRIPGQIVDVLVVRQEIATAHANDIRRLIRGYFEARAHLDAHPDDAARLMAPRLGVSPDELLASYEGMELPDLTDNHRILSGTPAPLEETAATLSALLVSNDLLKREPALQNLAVADYLPAARPR